MTPWQRGFKLGLWMIGVAVAAGPLVAANAKPAVPVAVIRIAGIEYVRIVDVCARLNLRLRESGNGQSVSIESGGRRGTLANRSREMLIDGVRVYFGDAAESRGGQFYVSRIDYERKLLPLWRPDLAGPGPRRPHVIVLDPGHGGWDSGARNSKLGLQEKKLTLDVALRLRPLLVAQGWTVILTRTRDTALGHTKDADKDARSAVAVENNADVFLSIHFDADAAETLQGSEIFSLAPTNQWASDDWSTRMAPRAKDALPGISATPFRGNQQDAWNVVLAHAIYRRLPQGLHTMDLGERMAHWRVLLPLTCPGVLVEPAYIANPAEALRAASPDFQQKVAEEIAAGLRDYADEIARLNPPPKATNGAPRP